MSTKQRTQAIATPQVSGKITIPYLFTPRGYQVPVMRYMDNEPPDKIGRTSKRAVTVWHRRCGKDITWLNQTIKAMLRAPFCGTYLHIFPNLTQGRRDIWDAKTSPDSGGRPFRAHFPPSLVMEASEVEMQITLRPMPHQQAQLISDGRGGTKAVGSIWQVMGTDKKSIENIRGMNAAGAVFSEFSDQNPEAWYSIIEPMLLENKGWAGFDFTPKGKNHAHNIYQAALSDPTWFAQLLSIEDTIRDGPNEDGTPVMTLAQIEGLRARGVPEEIIQQEYYCSFEGYLHGTIYGDLVRKAKADGRIRNVPWISTLPVGTMWDIGRTDQTAIWFYQCVNEEVRFIDYYANARQGIDHYVKKLHEKPYAYAKMIMPHDARVLGFSATQSPEEYIRMMVCRNVQIADKIGLQAGLDMVRRMFSRFYFDETKCDVWPHPEIPSGLQCLRSYHRQWVEDRQDYSGEPVHDAFSHGADALRTGVVGWEEGLHFLGEQGHGQELKVETYFDPRSMVGRR